jgi:hypothetical protein
MLYPETKPELHLRLDHNLTLHPPEGDEVIRRLERIREAFKIVGHQMIDLCPNGRELSLSLTHIEEACQYAIAAIARSQDMLPAVPSPVPDSTSG